MGMLCALALGSPPALLTDGAVARADELLALIPETDTRWRRTFERLTPSERGSLSSFLLDVALLDSARRNDFGSVARLLELAVGDGIADTPLCSQSAELLQRVAVAAEVAQEP
jgi:hypothetical protein